MLSIVTALHGKLALSQAYWLSLQAHPPSGPWEIIWVDDGSPDDTRHWLSTLPSPRHRVLLNEKNLGFAASNNRGVNAARGETIALLNNDLVLTPGWLDPLKKDLATLPSAGMIGNIQLNPATRLIDHAGIRFNLLGLGEHHLRGTRPPLRGPGAFHPAITAACALISRDLFISEGGFDEGYRNGCEDVDLCLRLGARGFRHWVSHRSTVFHHVGSSRGHREADPNMRRFLARWEQTTVELGRAQWPSHYLMKYRKTPLQYNLPKLLDAMGRLIGLRSGDSAWAAKRRAAILDLPDK